MQVAPHIFLCTVCTLDPLELGDLQDQFTTKASLQLGDSYPGKFPWGGQARNIAPDLATLMSVHVIIPLNAVHHQAL